LQNRFITKTVYGLVLKSDENETVSAKFLYKELFENAEIQTRGENPN
jgi:hypothetical protein